MPRFHRRLILTAPELGVKMLQVLYSILLLKINPKFSDFFKSRKVDKLLH